MKPLRLDEISTDKQYRYTKYMDPNANDNLCIFTVTHATGQNRSVGEHKKFPLTSEVDTYLEIRAVDNTGRSHTYDYTVTSFLKDFIENPTVEESGVLRVQRLLSIIKYMGHFDPSMIYNLLVELGI
jgi:hypothetical protein